jgi:hypothetical protein
MEKMSVAVALWVVLMPAPLNPIHGEAYLWMALLPQSQLFISAIKFLAGC